MIPSQILRLGASGTHLFLPMGHAAHALSGRHNVGAVIESENLTIVVKNIRRVMSLYGYAFGEVARLVYVAATHYSDVVAQQLQGQDGQ